MNKTGEVPPWAIGDGPLSRFARGMFWWSDTKEDDYWARLCRYIENIEEGGLECDL